MDTWAVLFSTNPDFGVAAGARELDSDRFTPIFAIHETPTEYEIEAAVPFAVSADVDVRAHRHDIVIRCKHAIDQCTLEPTPAFGAFIKRLHLAGRIDPTQVHTSMCHGMLTIRAPKLSS